ncbi:MAG: S1C family serine protease [Nannocystaceae bacterium]|nr:trypsin-like peptidase domain-containing protein [bacterium]
MSEAPSSTLWLAAGAGITGVLLGGAAVYLGARGDVAPQAQVRATPPSPEAAPADRQPPPAAPTLAEAVAKTMDSVVNLESSQGLGAGVIVDPSGIVLTNYHVLAEALRPPPTLFGTRLGAMPVLTARFADDHVVGASVLVADPDEDLAIVRLERPEGETLPYAAAAIGRSGELVVGQEVFAVGNPLGLRNTVSRGIVSALDRTGVLADPQQAVLQLDASINVGNSGGPLFNLRGELVGIVTARRQQAEGIAFALPMDHVRGFLEALTTPDGARSGVIGVTLGSSDAPPEAAVSLGYRAGLVVERVAAGGPASKAGLESGDVIVALRGKRLDGLSDTRTPALAAHLQKTVRGMFEGEVLGVTVIRGAKVLELSVEIAAASERDQIRIDAEELLGLGLAPSAMRPTIARVMPGTQLWGDPDLLVGATLSSVMGTDVAGYEDLAERLGEMRRIRQQRGGSPRVLVGFVKDGERHAALLRLSQ